MLTFKQATAKAAAMTQMHGKPWLVFKTPSSAPCNQSPASMFNTGRYECCAADERADYEAGGAVFVEAAPVVEVRQ